MMLYVRIRNSPSMKQPGRQLMLHSIKRGYCDRIREPDFWGGESELLVLSQLLKQPIIVYKRADEHTNGGGGSAFIPIEEYGTEFTPKKAVRLLLIHLSDRNHYDLLV
ncbi:OVARIAN TUMOR DOMAIN-containing deubiquitinating enzyme 3 isoform X1 [Rosa chinensis]|uniref:OVARIAN TUMOR DOMAIN-containing deubiquitinating enzyme 3 isoform X1 n=1 Tax=Rosa chinensis TaxID=74649 RepID=UPI001AD942CF|nr:OVARIAN TUMOR DOMAIN-containing deubiquitinating enzyme 3 isoform X1 [Rosa chinensis]